MFWTFWTFRLLVKRNENVEFLYKRMKVQQYVMNKAEMHYNQMLQDIQLLKQKAGPREENRGPKSVKY